MPRALQVAELRGNLAKFLQEAENGAEFVVMSRNRAVARIGPPAGKQELPFGALEGQIEMAPDFDDLPEDILLAMEQGDVFP